ncbi:MAG TPA: DUF1993 domain-containing protein [Azospira sp.]|nr:DUF1993 domain-containing protein [Azospira sp.]
MNLSFYQASVPVFDRALANLSAILAKGAAHAAAQGLDPAELLQARLAPDMFPLVRQVQSASDTAKGAAARLAGLEVPRYEDTESTFAELQARIERTRAFLASVPPAFFEGAAERAVVLTLRSGEKHFDGSGYLLNFALPNFFFHVVTAYDILRHRGVDIGKRDYLGEL